MGSGLTFIHCRIRASVSAMARPLRIEFAGAYYHLTARGDRQEDIFVDDGDREDFLDLLGKVCGRFEWTIHAWCLMSNHYHLVAETAHPNLSRGMRQLNGVYTQRFNRRHSRVGHVFQGRYTAILATRQRPESPASSPTSSTGRCWLPARWGPPASCSSRWAT